MADWTEYVFLVGIEPEPSKLDLRLAEASPFVIPSLPRNLFPENDTKAFTNCVG